MSELKLLNCPFCGGEAKYISFTQGLFVQRFVTCTKCGIETPRNCLNRKDAIKRWNTRKSMANIVEKLEEEYVDRQKNMNLVKDEDGNEAGHIYDEYLNKSIAYETAIKIAKQEINNGLE